MKFVCTGIVLVVLLASALARPNYFPGLRIQNEAEISDQPFYQCFTARNCAGYIKNVHSMHECCSHVKGAGFWDYAKCTPWLVHWLNFMHNCIHLSIDNIYIMQLLKVNNFEKWTEQHLD